MTVSKASLSKIQYTTPIDDIPDGPTLSAVDAGASRVFDNGAATVTATNAATGGGSITSYTVTPNPATSPATFTGTSPVTVTNLASNQSYTFTATATNAKGVSPFSGPASSSITATTVPPAPTIGTATRTSDTVASLTFTAPANTGGQAITSYVIESSPSLAGGITTQAGTTSPLTATGTFLGDPQSYTFTIKAVNTNGPGAASAASNSLAVKTSADGVDAQYVVLAGGGGAGNGQYSFDQRGGGGGAGGFRTNVVGAASGRASAAEDRLLLQPSTNYTVTVGAGGPQSTNGSNSVFSTKTSIGGGQGSAGSAVGQNGGSGGGSCFRNNGTFMGGGLGTAGQGFDVTYVNDKTGGAGTGSSNSGYVGGSGTSTSITGSAILLGGGGGAGGTNAGGTDGGGNGSNNLYSGGYGGAAGSANFGGGGGGGSGADGGNVSAPGGAGGSGRVIIKYQDFYTITVGAGLTGSTTGPSGGYKITTLTAGTGNVSWA